MVEQIFTQQNIFFAIRVAAFGLLLTERLRNDLVAVLIILALAISGILKPDEALAGFSSEAAVVVAAIFVLSAGLHQTGFSETLGHLDLLEDRGRIRRDPTRHPVVYHV